MGSFDGTHLTSSDNMISTKRPTDLRTVKLGNASKIFNDHTVCLNCFAVHSVLPAKKLELST